MTTLPTIPQEILTKLGTGITLTLAGADFIRPLGYEYSETRTNGTVVGFVQNFTDDDPTTFLFVSGGGSAGNANVVVKFRVQEVTTFDSLGIGFLHSYQSGSSGASWSTKLEKSDDDDTYTEIFEETTSGEHTKTAVNQSAKFFRLTLDTTGGGVGVSSKIEVYFFNLIKAIT